MRRPAGRKKCQSGSRLGIGPSVLHRLRDRTPRLRPGARSVGCSLPPLDGAATHRSTSALLWEGSRRCDVWNRRRDALVVGSGSGRASAAYWLLQHGHCRCSSSTKRFPREKTPRRRSDPAGGRPAALDGPRRRARGVPALRGPALDRPTASRSSSRGRSTPTFPRLGYVVRRRDLDEMVADQAVKAPAPPWPAPRPWRRLVEGGLVTGRRAPRRRSGVDRAGPGSDTWSWPTAPTPDSAGRSAPNADRSVPDGHGGSRLLHAVRTTMSPGSRATSTSGTARATPCPATAGSSRCGDGTVNVGVGLLDTFTGFKAVNTTKLMDGFVCTRPPAGASRPEASCGPPTGGQLPHRWIGHTEGRADLDRRGRCRGLDQPVQRRGHRLRLRDRPPRGRRSTRRSPPATASPGGTRDCSTSSTAAASRWPASS